MGGDLPQNFTSPSALIRFGRAFVQGVDKDDEEEMMGGQMPHFCARVQHASLDKGESCDESFQFVKGKCDALPTGFEGTCKGAAPLCLQKGQIALLLAVFPAG